MLQNLVIPEVRELISLRDWENIKALLQNWPAPDIAKLLCELDEETEMPVVFRLIKKESAADVFSELDPEIQEMLLQQMNNQQIKQILIDLPPDDRTSLFEELPGKITRQLINLLPTNDRRESLKLLGYPEYSVGRLMTPDYVAVRPEWTLERALSHIRLKGRNSETLNIIYVVDEQWKFVDAMELRYFILGSPDQQVHEILDHSFVKLLVTDEQEKAVEVMEHYNISALPVVDADETLLGIVTFDDVMDVAKEEVTEDFHKTAAVNPLEESYLSASPFTLYKKRIGWLLALIFMNIFSGAVISSFEVMISQVVALVFFLPLLIGSSGNAGSQASTLVVRAMTTHDVEMKDWLKLFSKDFFVSLLLGVTMALIVSGLGFLRVGSVTLALVLAVAMLVNVIIGSIMGTLLPFILRLFRLDPAAASAPLIASLADISGVLIYFSVASLIL